MKDANVIWSNDIDGLWGDEVYQRETYEAAIEDGYIDADYPFEEWLEKDFYTDYDGMNLQLENMNEDYYDTVKPIIDRQADSVPEVSEWGGSSPIFLIGNRSGWRSGSGGLAFDSIDQFNDWVLHRDYDNTTEICNDGGYMYLISYDHDGTTSGTLYTFPTTKEGMMALIKNCTVYPADVADYRDEYPGMSDDEIMWELFYSDVFGGQYETDYRHFVKYPEYLEPIHAE
jgi:hypothetical protein